VTNTNKKPLLEDVLAQLRQMNPQLQEQWGVQVLAVFGSVARGEATTDSDVDLLFDYNRPLGLELITVGDYLEDKLGHKVDLLSKKAIRPKVWPYIKDEMRYV
jgi:uncharacterized protein